MGLFDGTPLERPVVCDRCSLDVRLCRCPPLDTPAEKQSLKFRLEKRKGGKLVTVVVGFHCSDQQLLTCLSALKSQCGAGGTINDGNVELQGDHTQRIGPILKTLGYRLQGEKK